MPSNAPVTVVLGRWHCETQQTMAACSMLKRYVVLHFAEYSPSIFRWEIHSRRIVCQRGSVWRVSKETEPHIRPNKDRAAFLDRSPPRDLNASSLSPSGPVNNSKWTMDLPSTFNASGALQRCFAGKRIYNVRDTSQEAVEFQASISPTLSNASECFLIHAHCQT
jgi:hypothetical protein